jgi:hypothetical protein
MPGPAPWYVRLPQKVCKNVLDEDVEGERFPRVLQQDVRAGTYKQRSKEHSALSTTREVQRSRRHSTSKPWPRADSGPQSHRPLMFQIAYPQAKAVWKTYSLQIGSVEKSTRDLKLATLAIHARLWSQKIRLTPVLQMVRSDLG